MSILEATNIEQVEPYWKYIHENLDDASQYVLSENNFSVAIRAKRQKTKKLTVAGKCQTKTSKQSTSTKKPMVPKPF